MRKIILLVLLGLTGGLCEAMAQTTFSEERIYSPFNADSSYFLGEWVIPATINATLDGQSLSGSEWDFNERTGLWKLKESVRAEFRQANVLILRFQILPYTLDREYQRREAVSLDPSFYETGSDSLSEKLLEASRRSEFEDTQLQQSGSLSRGIIVGTNQDFALESGLNFELSGMLTDDVSINASLTDRSIPFQPDGTTQNIREFDRVFIQLNAPQTRFEMGDVDISFEQSTFAKLNRRLQGAAGYRDTESGEYSGALSVVRGSFKSQSFQGRDGVQGPYRLTGREGEEFVIILAGTERVYINGEQVQRGEENDYIIDYGLGEVYFTNNVLIKDETRIVVEYEYSDQNFNRTLVAAEAAEEFFGGRFRIGASVIRQADGDELLSQQVLSEDDIEVLSQVGDDLDQAVVSGARLAEEEDEINVRYIQVDTLYNGQTYTVYKNVPGSVQEQYIVRFSKVDEGSGSYRRISTAVNGLQYEWIGPGQGNYEPFRRLPAPEKQQMAALNTSLNITENIEVFGEWAASSFDQNRFSGLDDDDNNDFSYLSGFRMSELNTGLGELQVSASRRYTGQRFQFFERTREVEFDRKWNISSSRASGEVLNEAEATLSPSENSSIGVEYGFIDRDDFKGYRQASSVVSGEPGILSLEYQQEWVQSEDEVLSEKGEWFRQRGQLGKEFFGFITPYMRFEQERREQRSGFNDSLLNTSLAFHELGPGVQLSFPELELDAGFVYREDREVLINSLEKASGALEQRYRMRYRPGDFFRTDNEVAIRSKEFTDAFIQTGERNRRGLLIRSVTDYETSGGMWNGQFFYEANTRRQALLQEAYIEVGPELGQYVWIDSNEDGVQQVDEFFPELSPNEGVYVKQFLPSDELLPVIDLKTRFRNEIIPFLNMEEGVPLNDFLRDITFRSRVDIAENSTREELSDILFLKLSAFRDDSTTVQGRIFWEKEAEFFTENSDINIVSGYNQSRNLSRRSSESQRSYTDLFYLSTGYRTSPYLRLFADFSSGKNRIQSDRLSSRNFDIRSFSVSPGAELLFNRSWQSSFSFSYSQKKDLLPAEDVQADIVKVVNSHRMFLFEKIMANARLEVRNTVITGSSTRLAEFELSEGTGEGINLIWSVGGSYRVSDLIRFTLNYDGRTVKDRPDIHTAKIVVSAVF